MSEEKIDYYNLLGIKPTSKLIQIKKAFRQKTKQHHPDRQTTQEDIENAREISAKLNKAYEILSNKQTRLQYDIQNGFKKQNKDNLTKLNEFKNNEIKNTKDNLTNLAQKSREIESKIKIKTHDNRIFDNAGLIISKARYGYLNLKKERLNSSDYKDDIYDIDVTDAVQCLVEHRGNNGGFIRIEDRFDKSKLLGFSEPNIKYNNENKKYIEIEYSFNNKNHYCKFENYEFTLIPKQEHIIKFIDKRNSNTSAIEMYYKHSSDGTKYPQTNHVDVASLSWASMQRPNKQFNGEGNMGTIIEVGGRNAMLGRNSMASLPKWEDIVADSDKDEDGEKFEYKLMMFGIGIVVIGCIGIGLWVVSRGVNRNKK